LGGGGGGGRGGTALLRRDWGKKKAEKWRWGSLLTRGSISLWDAEGREKKEKKVKAPWVKTYPPAAENREVSHSSGKKGGEGSRMRCLLVFSGWQRKECSGAGGITTSRQTQRGKKKKHRERKYKPSALDEDLYNSCRRREKEGLPDRGRVCSDRRARAGKGTHRKKGKIVSRRGKITSREC